MNVQRLFLIALVLFGVSLYCDAPTCADEVIRVGAKSFTEQQVLGELVAQLIERHTGLSVERRFGIGGTGLCHSAIVSGELDLYVEYTGTSAMDVLHIPLGDTAIATYRTVAREYRKRFDIEVLPPLGFDNTYALTVRERDARSNGWSSISDIVEESDSLVAGFTSEFVERPDGYPGLRRAYGVRFGEVTELDPGLMYDALRDGQLDAICAFATDGRLAAYPFRSLVDDRGFFPPYDAIPVVRGETLRRHPEIREALAELARAIDIDSMRKMNHAVDINHRLPRAVAEAWINQTERPIAKSIGSRRGGDISESMSSRRTLLSMLKRRSSEIGRKSIRHLMLTGLAMGFAIVIGIPIGILIHQRPRVSGPVLAFTEIVQTVPSLAMLAFLFAIYRTLGIAPAVTALVFYALLPIILNTFTGLQQVPTELREAANGIGMSPGQRLRWVELPLAMPVIMAGIRTAVVWTVGIATLSTYVGAGGLGDFISRGLARNDPMLTLLGAVPAGMMAIVLSYVLRWGEIRVRLKSK